jgi:hypothetical protein
MLSWLGRAAIRISAGSLLTAIVAGVPTWLVIAVGWPLPARVPDRARHLLWSGSGWGWWR